MFTHIHARTHTPAIHLAVKVELDRLWFGERVRQGKPPQSRRMLLGLICVPTPRQKVSSFLGTSGRCPRNPVGWGGRDEGWPKDRTINKQSQGSIYSRIYL